MERRVEVVEDSTHTVRNSVHSLQQVKALQARAENAKNHNRRNNVRILSLSKRAEGSRPEILETHYLRSPDFHALLLNGP